MFITDESITTDGSLKEFSLTQSFKSGTIAITYNGNLFYEFKEVTAEDKKLIFDFAPATEDVVTVSYYTSNSPAVGNATRYAGIRQIREKSLNPDITTGIITVTDATLESYLRDAEAYIDSIVGYWEKEYDTQRLTFPRVSDEDKNDITSLSEYATIPGNITRAAILAVENMYN